MKVYIGPYRDVFGTHSISDFLKRIGVKSPMRRKIINWWRTLPWTLYKMERKYKPQKIKVKIDDWDTWSADYTLAQIILPLLIRLKDVKPGSPLVDDEDVPEVIRSTYARPKENEWDVDEFHHQRWEWVLNEMIWAFNEIIKEPVEDSFDIGSDDWHWRSCLYNERLRRAFMLFGKYYQCLWT